MEDKVLNGQVSMFDEDVVDTSVEREEIVLVGQITTQGIIDTSGLDRIIKEEKLKIAKLDIENIEATEENLKLLKNNASEINKRKKEYDDTRKSIQKEWNLPLEEFLKKTKELDKFLEDSRLSLRDKSDLIEKEQIEVKTFEIKDYFNTHKANLDEHLVEPFRLDKFTFDDLKLNIIKSNSNTHYEKLIDEKLTKLVEELNVIKGNPNSIRLLSKWEDLDYNLTQALIEVQNDINKEQELKEREQASNVVKEEVKVDTPTETIPPKVEALITATFNLKGSRENLIKVREYAKSIGVEVL